MPKRQYTFSSVYAAVCTDCGIDFQLFSPKNGVIYTIKTLLGMSIPSAMYYIIIVNVMS